jgi:hypothetical protein
MHHPKQTGTDSHILDPGTRSGDLAGASCRGGSWRSARAEMQSPEVFPLGPFDTLPSSGTSVRSALAAYPRCLVRGVRTESSARAWTRTGRLRRFASVISFSSSFPNASPFNDPCLTKFEPLRLTHPCGVPSPGATAQRPLRGSRPDRERCPPAAAVEDKARIRDPLALN